MTAEFTPLILDNLVTAILLLDEELTIRYVNPATEQLFASSQRRLTHSHFPDLLQHSSLDLGLVQATLQSGQGLADTLHEKYHASLPFAPQFVPSTSPSSIRLLQEALA